MFLWLRGGGFGGGVALFLCWCGCVFFGDVVVFLRLCFEVFVIVLVVSLRLCFCVFVVVWFRFYGGVSVVVLLWREVLENRVTRQVLQKSAGGECCRRVL